MNIELLRKIRSSILENPQNFDMSTWFDSEDGCDENLIGRGESCAVLDQCGTTGCIAGWALHLTKSINTGNTFWEQAQKILELSKNQAENLFYVNNWPDKYRDAYNDEAGGDEAKITARRITAFIASNGYDGNYKEEVISHADC